MKSLKLITAFVLSGTLALSSLSAQQVQDEVEGYLVGEDVPAVTELHAPSAPISQSNLQSVAAPSRPSSKFKDVDDFQFGKGHGHGNGHGHGHGHHDGVYKARRKMMHATRGLNSMAQSGQIHFATFQARNYFSTSVHNINMAAHNLNHHWGSKQQALRVLNDNIHYLRYLRRDGHLRFWDDYGRRNFRRLMMKLREAKDSLQYRY